MTHGVMEYIKMVNHVENPLGTYYGQYEFNIYFKALKVLGLPIKSYGELTKIQKRTGVYTTFWGDYYIDFGLLGVILMIFIGYLVKKIYVKAVSGNCISILFYCYIGVVILGSPFINLLSGSIIYYFNALLIASIIYKYLPNKLFVFK
jgi:oligosaccharide repeat unit polymerase